MFFARCFSRLRTLKIRPSLCSVCHIHTSPSFGRKTVVPRSSQNWLVHKWCYSSFVCERSCRPRTLIQQGRFVSDKLTSGNDLECEEVAVSVDESDRDDLREWKFDPSDEDQFDYDCYVAEDSPGYVEDPEQFKTKKTYQSLVKKLISSFASSRNTRILAQEYKLEGSLYKKAIKNFSAVLVNKEDLKKNNKLLFNTVKNIINGPGHLDDLIPFFLELSCETFELAGPLQELMRISELSSPVAWFPSGGSVRRKLIYHAGPTNSGKTHAAFQRFLSAKNAIYCAPLRMLAHEIFHRSNKEGVPCDLLTGEEAQFASEDETKPASHISCTVEMANIYPDGSVYDVAVIDEIQMLKDMQRGGGWTRALLGLPAKEVHLCGDQSAIELVQKLARPGEEIEIIHYNRLVPLLPLKRSLRGSFKHIRQGDCVVTFSRKNIFEIRKQIENQTSHKCAVIYGGLPPATRVVQAELFNNPDSGYTVLVATDAIGMGLNL